MICFFTSSPCLPNSPDLNPANGFLTHLHSVLPETFSVLFVSAAPDDAAFSDWCSESMKHSFEISGFHLSNWVLTDSRTANQVGNDLFHSDLLILGGGHVPTQNVFLHSLGMKKLLKTWSGVVMSISAGSMNAADPVYCTPEEPGEATNQDFQRWLPGLGLTKTHIIPHYHMLKRQFVDGYDILHDIILPDSLGHSFYLLSDGSYVLRKNDGTETLYGECVLICDHSLVHLTDIGQHVLLQSD